MSFIVPEEELRFRVSRAGGPGGQHVNKTSTKVEVLWSIASSPSLTDDQRARLLERLGSRVDSRGVVRVTAGARRSQLLNRAAAVARLNELVQAALHRPRPRKLTRPTPAARERRLETKRRRSLLKRSRRPVQTDD